MDKNSRFFKTLIVGIILILVYKLIDNVEVVVGFFDNFLSVLFPCILGVVIAFFLNRPITKLNGLVSKSKIKLVQKKSLAISLTIVYLIVGAIIGFFIAFIIPPLKENINELINNLPGYYYKVMSFVESNEYLKQYDYSKIFIEKANDILTQIVDVKNINKYISIITGFANSVLSIFIGIVISIYLVFEKEGIFSFVRLVGDKTLKEKVRKPLYDYSKKGVDLFYSYFSGLALDSLIIAIVSTIVLSFFKVEYAVLLGFLIFVGNMIPFFGPIISAVLVFLISMISVGPINALWLLLFQFVLGQIDGNLIQPRVLSVSTGISPLLVLVSVIIFGELMGPIGMVVGVPVCALLKMIFLDYLNNKKVS